LTRASTTAGRERAEVRARSCRLFEARQALDAGLELGRRGHDDLGLVGDEVTDLGEAPLGGGVLVTTIEFLSSAADLSKATRPVGTALPSAAYTSSGPSRWRSCRGSSQRPGVFGDDVDRPVLDGLE
jgi:hypothetical protein